MAISDSQKLIGKRMRWVKPKRIPMQIGKHLTEPNASSFIIKDEILESVRYSDYIAKC